MPSRCIFCGNDIRDRSQEHVLPRWLIALGGEINRPIALPIGSGERKSLPFGLFTTSTCRICNTMRADLEGRAKAVVLRLLAQKPLFRADLHTLIDWLEKTRLVSWHHCYKSLHGQEPSPTTLKVDGYHHRHDTVVWISRCRQATRHIELFIGGSTFSAFPSCMGLFANELCLIHTTLPGLLSDLAHLPQLPESLPHSERISRITIGLGGRHERPLSAIGDSRLRSLMCEQATALVARLGVASAAYREPSTSIEPVASSSLWTRSDLRLHTVSPEDGLILQSHRHESVTSFRASARRHLAAVELAAVTRLQANPLICGKLSTRLRLGAMLAEQLLSRTPDDALVAGSSDSVSIEELQRLESRTEKRCLVSECKYAQNAKCLRR